MKKILIAMALLGAITACTNNSSENKTTAEIKVIPISSPVSDSCAEPYLFTDKNGIVYLSWIEKRGKEATLKFSSMTNNKWDEPIIIANGNNWFVNWADYPVIVSDGDKNLLAHFLEKSDTAKFTYDVKLALSADTGKSWGTTVTLNDDGKKAEHGFVSIVPFKEGFFTCWLDGRKTAMEGDMDHQEGHHGEMTVRAALLDKSGKKINEWELDGRVCDCCQTTAAITSDGPVVVYRDRSDSEVRDMSIVRFVNGSWTAPQTIYADNWQIKACPVNGPRADALKNNLAIAWFSAKEKKGEVKIVFSKDGGATFAKPIRIDEGKAIGRVDVLLLDEKTAMVSWMEGPSVKAVKVNADGVRGSSITIASSSESRSGGFPQMTLAGNKIIFAWTDDKEKTIRLARLDM